MGGDGQISGGGGLICRTLSNHGEHQANWVVEISGLFSINNEQYVAFNKQEIYTCCRHDKSGMCSVPLVILE